MRLRKVRSCGSGRLFTACMCAAAVRTPSLLAGVHGLASPHPCAALRRDLASQAWCLARRSSFPLLPHPRHCITSALALTSSAVAFPIAGPDLRAACVGVEGGGSAARAAGQSQHREEGQVSETARRLRPAPHCRSAACYTVHRHRLFGHRPTPLCLASSSPLRGDLPVPAAACDRLRLRCSSAWCTQAWRGICRRSSATCSTRRTTTAIRRSWRRARTAAIRPLEQFVRCIRAARGVRPYRPCLCEAQRQKPNALTARPIAHPIASRRPIRWSRCWRRCILTSKPRSTAATTR